MKFRRIEIGADKAEASLLRNGLVKKTVALTIEDHSVACKVILQPHSPRGETTGHIGLPRDWRILRDLSEELREISNDIMAEEQMAQSA